MQSKDPALTASRTGLEPILHHSPLTRRALSPAGSGCGSAWQMLISNARLLTERLGLRI